MFGHHHPRAAAAFFGALASWILLTLLANPSADAAVHERVKVSIPDPGQLAAARLQFKVEGDKTPKLKIKLKNARDLPDEVIAASRMTRSTEKKGRAVALLAIANVPPPAARRRAPRVTGQSALIDVSPAGTGANISEIEFQNVPGSRNFASVLGLEPGGERQKAQQTFDVSGNEIPDDPLGRFDLPSALDVMDLKAVEQAKVVTRPSFQEEVEELFRDRAIASAIAAAVGPPAVLDADLYSLVTGNPPPSVLQSTFGPSQSNPSLYFAGVQYTVSVMGAQVSQASEFDLLGGPDARCENGLFNEGLVTRGTGPLLTFRLSYRLDCDLPQDHPVVFFDVPLEGSPPPGIDLFKFMPFPSYGSEEIGEAVGGEQTTIVIMSR
jgi:hypothetical protein